MMKVFVGMVLLGTIVGVASLLGLLAALYIAEHRSNEDESNTEKQ